MPENPGSDYVTVEGDTAERGRNHAACERCLRVVHGDYQPPSSPSVPAPALPLSEPKPDGVAPAAAPATRVCARLPRNVSLSWAQLLGLAFLVFIAGSATMYYQVSPGVFLRDAFAAGKALRIRLSVVRAAYNPLLWKRARHLPQGVTGLRSQQGL